MDRVDVGGSAFALNDDSMETGNATTVEFDESGSTAH